MIGIGAKTYDGIPRDGNAIKWNSQANGLYLKDAFDDSDSGSRYEWSYITLD